MLCIINGANLFHYFCKHILHLIKLPIAKCILDSYLSHPFLDVWWSFLYFIVALRLTLKPILSSNCINNDVFLIFFNFNVRLRGRRRRFIELSIIGVLMCVYSRVNHYTMHGWFFLLIRLPPILCVRQGNWIEILILLYQLPLTYWFLLKSNDFGWGFYDLVIWGTFLILFENLLFIFLFLLWFLRLLYKSSEEWKTCYWLVFALLILLFVS